MKAILLVAFCSLTCTLSASAEKPEDRETPAQTTPASRAPAFHNTRFVEDWSDFLNDQDQHVWPSLKRIELGDSGAFLSFGGQIRLRGETFRNFGFGGPGSRDATFGLSRIRLHADLQLSPHVRFFAEAKSSLATGRDLPGGNRTLDTDSLDLQNAFADFTTTLGNDSSLTLRIGRREIQYGRQRLVSPLDWGNTRPRAFDGFSTIWKGGAWQVDSFWAKHVPVRKYSFNRLAPGTQFFGAYAAGRPARLQVDLYWLGLDRKAATFGGVSGRDRRHTFGARVGGSASGIDFDVEAAFQTGDHAGRNVGAAMVGSQVGWRPSQAGWNTRLFTGFDFGSGDSDPADDHVGTFNQLFPLGHAYLGHVDVLGRQNVVDWSQGVSFAPASRFSLTIAHHIFWRARTSDAVYNVGGGILRPATAGTASGIGNELNIDGSLRVNRHFVYGFGYGRFFAGKFIEQSGPDDDVNFWYNSIQFTF